MLFEEKTNFMEENDTFLKNIPIFSNLNDNILSEITKLGSRKIFNKDSTILFQNQSDPALILVIKGELRLSKINSEGSEITLGFLKESEFWGDTAILDGKSPSVNITSEKDSEVFIIKRDDLVSLLKSKPEFSIEILNEVTKQLRALNQKIKCLSLKASDGKVASVIIHLLDDFGIIKDKAIEIEKLPVPQVLADMAGTSRETISRTLHSFAKKGLIELDGQKLIVKSYEKFKELFN